MLLKDLMQRIEAEPDSLEFQDVMSVIDNHYVYTPTRFTNGQGDSKQDNAEGTNEGSCKIFAFGLIQQLTEQQVLACFGRYYREDVLQHPEGTSHGNIRAFMKSGWAAVVFDSPALKKK